MPVEADFSYAGERFVLGSTPDSYVVCDARKLGNVLAAYPLTYEGWSWAWVDFIAAEPDAKPWEFQYRPDPQQSEADSEPDENRWQENDSEWTATDFQGRPPPWAEHVLPNRSRRFWVFIVAALLVGIGVASYLYFS